MSTPRQHRRNLRKLAEYNRKHGLNVSPDLARLVYSRDERIGAFFARLRFRIRNWWRREVERQITAAQRHQLAREIEESNRPLERAGMKGWQPSAMLRMSEEAYGDYLVEQNASGPAWIVQGGVGDEYEPKHRSFARAEFQHLGDDRIAASHTLEDDRG